MSCKAVHTGRETITMLKDIFNIGDIGIRKLTLVAEIGNATTIQIDTFAKLNDVDIASTEIYKGTVFESCVYEVTIKKVIKDEIN